MERLAEGLKHCLGHVAARVALERLAGGFEGFEAGQAAVLNALKTDVWGL